MPRKISDETIKLMEELYAQDLPTAEVARRANVSYTTAWGYHKAKQRGFASFSEYYEHLAKQRGFDSLSDYYKYIDKQRGFDSLSDYQKHIAKQKQRRLKNRELSNLIERRLKKLGENQSWLANQIDVSRQMVSMYAHGECIPNEGRLQRLFSAINVPYRTLDDLLGDGR